LKIDTENACRRTAFDRICKCSWTSQLGNLCHCD